MFALEPSLTASSWGASPEPLLDPVVVATLVSRSLVGAAMAPRTTRSCSTCAAPNQHQQRNSSNAANNNATLKQRAVHHQEPHPHPLAVLRSWFHAPVPDDRWSTGLAPIGAGPSTPGMDRQEAFATDRMWSGLLAPRSAWCLAGITMAGTRRRSTSSLAR